MKTNPGGQLAIDEIFGRDILTESIWETLVQQSIIMKAERRISKTSIMTLLKEKPKDY